MRVKSSFSMTKALSAAFSSLPQALGGAWLVLLLLWAIGTFGPLAIFHHHHAALIVLPVAVIAILLKLMTMGALYRIDLFGKDAGREGLGFGGLQLGWPELRLFLAQIVAGLFVLTICLALFIVFAVGLSTSGAAGDGTSLMAVCAAFRAHQSTGDWVIITYVLGSAVFLVFVALKFSLLHAANIAQRRLVTLNALGLTSGNVGKLFIGLCALAAPFLFLSAAVMHLFGPQIRLAHAMPYPWMGQRMHIILHGGMMLVHIAVVLPLLVGFFASAYRQITAGRAT